jgi:DNA repair protein RadD
MHVMSFVFFPDQADHYLRIQDAFSISGYENVLAVAGTGSGKTVIGTKAIQDNTGVSLATAHKSELIENLSETLAKRGILHCVICDAKTEASIRRNNIKETGRDWLTAPIRARTIVTSIQIIRSRKTNPIFRKLMRNVTFVLIDEAHHATLKNSYGLLLDKTVLPRLERILGLTGSPRRTDGLGLGRHHDGIFDILVKGASQRELMSIRRISRWEVHCVHGVVEAALADARIPKNSRGDNLKKQAETLSGTKIIGDIVQTYQSVGKGHPGAIFLPSIELSKKTADNFNAFGIPAIHLDGGTDKNIRNRALRDLVSGTIRIICNVGLFDEGVNIPTLKYVGLAFQTTSLIKWLQIWGRVLRAGVPGILADHCGNWAVHGRPDEDHMWNLDRSVRKQDKGDVIALRSCENAYCTGGGKFERHLSACPYCGWEVPENPPLPRPTPKQVEGDLTKLTPEMLDELNVDYQYLQKPEEEIREEYMRKTCDNVKITAYNVARFRKNRNASAELADLIQAWRGVNGLTDVEAHKWFWINMGVTVPEALGRKTTEIREIIEKFNAVSK